MDGNGKQPQKFVATSEKYVFKTLTYVLIFQTKFPRLSYVK